MRFFTTLLILLGIKYILSSDQCRSNESCRCFDGFGKYEFQCFNSFQNILAIETEPDKYLKMSCNLDDFDLDILPNYTAGNIELYDLHYCKLSQDEFYSSLEKFGIKNLEKLLFYDIVLRSNSEESASITKDFFHGLTYLKSLDISYLGSSIEVDAFENLSNLIDLRLVETQIEKMSGMFNNLKNLKALELTRNSLTNIPSDTFISLAKLERLLLWKNNLTRIAKYDFAGLKHLQSLELDRNYIQNIDNDAFLDLPQLTKIGLSINELGHVSSSLFRNNRKLISIRMDRNPNVTLEDYCFANLEELTEVNLEESGLTNTPEHIFEGSTNLKMIEMQNNLLEELPRGLFSGLTKLYKLFLGKNRISNIPDELLSSLVNLEELHLEHNLISEISDRTFEMTKNLKKLVLNNNKIKTIVPSAFESNKNLIFVNLSNNLFSMKHGNPFKHCFQLERLLLSGNFIDEFPSSMMCLMHLKELDLSYNNITNIVVADLRKVTSGEMVVHLNNNKISELDFITMELLSIFHVRELDTKNSTMNATIVFLNHNTLVCDCRLYHLVRYVRNMTHPAVKTVVDLRLGNNSCASPTLLQHKQIKDLQPQHISCPYSGQCKSPSECRCFLRPFDETVVVDCSFKNLTECPRIEVVGERVEINLAGNGIRNGPNSSLGYDNVTSLILSNNSVEQLNWIPPRTKILKLDGNHLKHLDAKVLRMMNASSVLSLSNNPWSCDCSAIDFQNFVRRKFDKESRDILCEDRVPLIEKTQLCEPVSTLIMKISIPTFVLLVFAAIITALYFRYEQEVKIWLYDHKLLLWLVTEKELDKDKIYDIFISFSHEDEEFVVKNLLPGLEHGPDPFKTCIHLRDWKPGLSIIENITNSVNDSRRTLVVLSNNFLGSVWGKMEFRAAHIKAIEEGRARVIVIKCGELEEEKLDEELKIYLKTNTYVEWGKPWFWRKLRYVLPHSRPQKEQKRANSILKHVGQHIRLEMNDENN